jgi:hypothetical protein
MKFTGKQLLDLGCPQNKIKFFVGVEFESEEDFKQKLQDAVKPKESKEKSLNSFHHWIWNTFSILPMMFKGEKAVPMSKSELGRILDSGGIQVNNIFPKSNDEVIDDVFPIKTFIWFPKSKTRKTTWIS